ncbi:hypothetical protein BRD56_00720 [Thermoplasmatales archaeon SW_10_69_26]|nr:MAG: hypothetical protein BRD56_00720 [Thermoplasmatales archaeon SW_10_69_26]
MPRAVPLVALLALLALPTAGAHGLISLDLVLPTDCPGEGACLATRENHPRLHAGERVDVNVYNDDRRDHRIHITTGSRADPANGTPTEAALVASQRLPANASQAVGELAIPARADELYAWCSLADHEAAGEHLTVPLAAPHDEDPAPTAAPSTGAAVLALAAIAGLLRRR